MPGGMGGGGYDEIEELYDGIEMDDRERVWRYKYDGGRQY